MSAAARPVVRPLTPQEADAVAAARLVAVEAAPYLAHALFAMRMVAAEGLGTFAVDRQWRCYIDPAALAAWGTPLAGGVLLHESMHLIRDHGERAEMLGTGRDHTVWNYAADAAINDDVLAAGVALPEGVVTPAGLGLPEGGIEESYYQQLIQDRPELASQNNSQQDGVTDDQTGHGEPGGCGSGAGDPITGWELPGGDQDAPGLSSGEAEMTRRLVAHAIRDHAATRRGSVPAGLDRWASQTLDDPAVPWQQILASTIRRAIGWARGAADFTYSRPGRRQIPGIITPAMRRPLITAAVVVDTSGSMSQDMIDAALAEVAGVIRAAGLGPRRLAVLACDADVAAITRVRRVQDVRMAGGGGTDMRIGIEAAHHLRPAPDVVIVLTDGYTPWPGQPARARLIAGIIGPEPRLDAVPAWATAIPIHIP